MRAPRPAMLALAMLLAAGTAACVPAPAGSGGAPIQKEEIRPADKTPGGLADPFAKGAGAAATAGAGATPPGARSGATTTATAKEPTVSAGMGKVVGADSPRSIAALPASPSAFVVTLQRAETTTAAGTTETSTSLSFTPDPPQIVLPLYAPAGSQGAKLAEAAVSYDWTVVGAASPTRYPAERFPIAPTSVPLASASQDGPVVKLSLPLPVTGVRQAYKADTPDVVTAHVRFFDADGQVVKGKDSQPFELLVPFRKKA